MIAPKPCVPFNMDELSLAWPGAYDGVPRCSRVTRLNGKPLCTHLSVRGSDLPGCACMHACMHASSFTQPHVWTVLCPMTPFPLARSICFLSDFAISPFSLSYLCISTSFQFLSLTHSPFLTCYSFPSSSLPLSPFPLPFIPLIPSHFLSLPLSFRGQVRKTRDSESA